MYLSGLRAGEYRPHTGEYVTIMAVLKQQPHYARKAAAGITGIRIGYHPTYSRTKVVYLMHTDGTESDIKYVKPYPKAPAAAQLIGALRTAIMEQVHAYKVATYTAKSRCVHCECKLTRTNTHVDHVLKFRDLCSAFKEKHGEHKHPLADNAESGRKFAPEDAAYEQAWQDYHREHAVYRLLCAPCNMRMR